MRKVDRHDLERRVAMRDRDAAVDYLLAFMAQESIVDFHAVLQALTILVLEQTRDHA